MRSALSRFELIGPCAGVRDPYCRRPFQRRAVGAHRRTVQDSVAGAAMPAHVTTAAVTKADDMTDEHLVRA
jgi:hypothetical protein